MGDDRRHPVALPVLAVVVGKGDVVAPPCQLGECALLVRRNGVRRRRVRRTQEARIPSGDPREHRLGQLDLQAALPHGPAGQSGVRERVVPELVPSPDEPPHDVRIARRLAPDLEERRWRVRGAQDGGDLRRPAGVRAVVERQRYAAAGGALDRGKAVSPGREDRPGARERSRCARLIVRLAGRADGVRRDPLEGQHHQDNEQAEREQAPVPGWAPDSWRDPAPSAGVSRPWRHDREPGAARCRAGSRTSSSPASSRGSWPSCPNAPAMSGRARRP